MDIDYGDDDDDDEGASFKLLSTDMATDDPDYASEFENARQSFLLRRKQKAENLIDTGNRLSIDTRREVAALKWAISVIVWDREAGIPTPGREQSGLDQCYTLEKAEERERKMRGVLSRQSIETAKMLVVLGVMREEVKEDGNIVAVYTDRIHPIILSSIEHLQAIGKGLEAITQAEFRTRFRPT